MRNYPEQPPIIPHSIDNYQLRSRPIDARLSPATIHRRLRCADDQHHPLHDRNGQVLADVTPRRYFCTAATSADGRAAAGSQHVQGHASRRSREEVRTCNAAAQVTPDLVLAHRQPSQRASEPRFLALGGSSAASCSGAPSTCAENHQTPRSSAPRATKCATTYSRNYSARRTSRTVGRPRQLSRLPRAARMDRQDRRKMQASKEVWGKTVGTIDTRQKFQDHRLELAKHNGRG